VPLISEDNLDAIATPAASSAALLMRLPEKDVPLKFPYYD
jgi:hypothetical protein